MIKKGYELIAVFTLLILFVSPRVIAETSVLLSENLFKVTESSSYSNTLGSDIKVNFKSYPSGATIFIDGIEVGSTPKQIYLSPGQHSARIIKSGQVPVEFDFNLETNLRYTYTIRSLLKPLTSKLILMSSHPQEHTVEFNCQALRGSGNFLYSWDFGNGYTENHNSSTLAHTYFNNGSYKVKCIIYDQITGKRTQSQKTVVIRP